MFVTHVITAWGEALIALLHDETYPETPVGMPNMQDIPILTEYPQKQVEYPGLWINFTMQGDVKNVGIGHVEWTQSDTGFTPAYRWQFGGFIEITLGALSNLERALMIDELTRSIAVARVDENREGILRKVIEQHDLVGQNVVWESFTLSGFGEAQGTPWGTDDVIYEATVTLQVEGEIVLNPVSGEVVPLEAVTFTPQTDTDPIPLPVPGVDGWR